MDFTQVLNQTQVKPTRPPVVVHPLDATQAQKQLAVYHAQINQILAQAQKIEVIDDTTNKQAVEIVAEIKKLYRQIEAKRKELIEEPNKYVRSVNAFAKQFTEKLKQIESILKKKIGEYQYKLELERRKREEEARKEAEKLQKKLEEEAKKAGVEVPQVPEPVIPKQKTITRTDSGASATIRKVWDFEVIDLSQVPREYLMLDEKKVRQAIRMGVREIPGLRIYERVDTVVRT